MATVTINGTDLNTDEPKLVQWALAKARRDEKKAAQVREDAYKAAQVIAERHGFKILSRKASGDTFPVAWKIYRPGDKWSNHLFTTGIEEDGCFYSWKTQLVMPSPVVCHHFGNEFIGAVSDGGGYAWLIFLQEVRNHDNSRGPIVCYAVGSCDGAIALAECPGIDPSDFGTVS